MKIQNSALLSSLMAMVMAFSIPAESRGALSLVNADFQDSTGLTNLGGGWYGGVPAGWTGVNGDYSVMNWNSGNLAANLQVVGPGGPRFDLFTKAPAFWIRPQLSASPLTFSHLFLDTM